MPAQRIRIGTRESIAAQLTDQVASDARAAIAARGRCSLAIPGGSVAEVLVPRLASRDLPWERVHVFWCDERGVPLDDPASNAGTAMRRWAGTPLAQGARVHVMDGGAADLEAAARSYERALVEGAGDPPVLDLLVLGIGEDGHVASLFPGHPASAEARQWVVPVHDASKAPARRLTLTMPVLLGARHVILAAFGASKADVVRRSLEGPETPSPAAHLVRAAHHLTIMLDDAAARDVSPTPRGAGHE